MAKSNKLRYEVLLTREEAAVLCLLSRSSNGDPDDTVKGALDGIADALITADPRLEAAQFKLWKQLDDPVWDFGYNE